MIDYKKVEIMQYVKEFEEDWYYSEDIIYKSCISDMAKLKNLSQITENDIRGPVRTYLINWGMMGRVINRLNKKWIPDLRKSIKEKYLTLSTFRKLDLATTKTTQYQHEIDGVYISFRKIIGPTSASKLLFLIAPNFFPMWDTKIREKLLGGNKTSNKDYYRFIGEIQNILRIHGEVIQKLNKLYRKSKLKIIDEFLWKKTR